MKRIQALAPGLMGPGRTEIETRPLDWRSVVSSKTRAHERHHARLGVSRHTCGHRGIDYKPSFARTAMALIEDVHSIMDAWPRHALWDVEY